MFIVYCVDSFNDDSVKVYGPFDQREDAEKYCEKYNQYDGCYADVYPVVTPPEK